MCMCWGCIAQLLISSKRSLAICMSCQAVSLTLALAKIIVIPQMSSFCALQKLEALIIPNTRVRRPAADRLQAMLPNLRLLEC